MIHHEHFSSLQIPPNFFSEVVSSLQIQPNFSSEVGRLYRSRRFCCTSFAMQRTHVVPTETLEKPLFLHPRVEFIASRRWRCPTAPTISAKTEWSTGPSKEVWNWVWVARITWCTLFRLGMYRIWLSKVVVKMKSGRATRRLWHVLVERNYFSTRLICNVPVALAKAGQARGSQEFDVRLVSNWRTALAVRKTVAQFGRRLDAWLLVNSLGEGSQTIFLRIDHLFVRGVELQETKKN